MRRAESRRVLLSLVELDLGLVAAYCAAASALREARLAGRIALRAEFLLNIVPTRDRKDLAGEDCLGGVLLFEAEEDICGGYQE